MPGSYSNSRNWATAAPVSLRARDREGLQAAMGDAGRSQPFWISIRGKTDAISPCFSQRPCLRLISVQRLTERFTTRARAAILRASTSQDVLALTRFRRGG